MKINNFFYPKVIIWTAVAWSLNYSQNGLIAQDGFPSKPIPNKNFIIREYKVNRFEGTLTIDGILDEQAWYRASYTKSFVIHTDGSDPVFSTKAQMVWDDSWLYIAFTVEDKDIWATKKNHDDRLWREEAVELFIDPDGDGINYIELQINPLGTTCDILLNKEFAKGGRANFKWTLEGLRTGIFIDGTLNDADEDIQWICEIALPFQSMAFSAPSIHFPQDPGDTWRINLCRMETDHKDRKNVEATAWNQTDTRGFHAPNRFGRIIFFGELAK